MERLRCVVERITYRNETNGYSVIKCRARGYQDLVGKLQNLGADIRIVNEPDEPVRRAAAG